MRTNHPNDERYKHLVGKTCILPLMDREIPIVADEYVEMDVNQVLLVEGDEHMAHRPAQPLVHGEAGALPVGGDAQLLLLLDDAGAVFGLPFE